MTTQIADACDHRFGESFPVTLNKDRTREFPGVSVTASVCENCDSVQLDIANPPAAVARLAKAVRRQLRSQGMRL